MKIAVIGYGIDGKSATAYWLAKGDEVTICDGKDILPNAPKNAKTRLGKNHLSNLEEFDLIVRSSGIKPATIVAANPNHPEVAQRITSGIVEFLRACPTEHVIGITGTKGKGTTSTIVTKMLRASGKTVHLGGNIGIAALDLLPSIQPQDFVVLELSSFQLIDCQERIPTAACLMIAPEHLNWHEHMQEYIDAKAQLFRHQTAEDRAIYNANSTDSVAIASSSPATTKQAYDVPAANAKPSKLDAAYVKDDAIYYQNEKIIDTVDVRLPGRHNLENICAAITIVWPFIDHNLDAIRQVITTFSGLPHHTEYVTTIDDIAYYNDSYSTMPDATIAALEAISGKKVLILGGGSKGLALDAMMEAVAAADIRHIVLMGSLANELATMLEDRGIKAYSYSQNGMADIVKEARAHAQPGDTVLLSPGLPAKGDGFFIDNVDRGNQFKVCLGITPESH